MVKILVFLAKGTTEQRFFHVSTLGIFSHFTSEQINKISKYRGKVLQKLLQCAKMMESILLTRAFFFLHSFLFNQSWAGSPQRQDKTPGNKGPPRSTG